MTWCENLQVLRCFIDEQQWTLPANTSLKNPRTWQIADIVESISSEGEPLYDIKWENSFEPAAHIPQKLLADFEKRQRKKVEKQFIEVEAVVDEFE